MMNLICKNYQIGFFLDISLINTTFSILHINILYSTIQIADLIHQKQTIWIQPNIQ